MKAKWNWLPPPWAMPTDPVKAVFWFLRWFLQVLVRYFPVLILGGVAYETYLNGAVGLFGTLLVGVIVWLGLAALSVVVNITSSVSKVYSEFSRYRPTSSFSNTARPDAVREEKVVEGSIITDLDEERRRRRQEM